MKVTENTKLRNGIMKTLSGERFTPRTFAITRLVCCPRKTYYMMGGVQPTINDSSILNMARGRGIGTEIQRGFKKTEVEVKRDDIRGDIDAIGELIAEIYSTNLSLKSVEDISKVPEVFGIKVKQLMAYCYIKNEKKGDLIVFFLSGDYSRFTDLLGEKIYTGISPELKCWTLEFTDKELNDNWKKILDNREEIREALRTGSPPLCVGEKWECKLCGFAYTCLGEEPVADKKGEIPFTMEELK